MTKVRFHGPIAGFSGAMGEMVFDDHEAKGKTVAYMKRHLPLSEAAAYAPNRRGGKPVNFTNFIFL